MTITSLDGYRWLKNDIIRGNFQPDEKLRMSLLTSRYALGVGPLREALSQLVAERLVTVVNQKGYRVASMSEQELLDIFDARANMEAMLVSLAIARGGGIGFLSLMVGVWLRRWQDLVCLSAGRASLGCDGAKRPLIC